RLAFDLAVAGLVGERVGTVVVDVRRVAERAVGVEGQAAVRRPAHGHGGEWARAPGVVGEHTARRDDQVGVLVGLVTVRAGERCVGQLYRDRAADAAEADQVEGEDGLGAGGYAAQVEGDRHRVGEGNGLPGRVDAGDADAGGEEDFAGLLDVE